MSNAQPTKMTASTRRTLFIGPLIALLLAGPCAAGAELPAGWFSAGTKPQSYTMGSDHEVYRSGRGSAFIRSKDAGEIDGFGTLMQNVAADRYRGQRVRLSGFAKSDGIEDWAGFWMRVDPEIRAAGRALAFDNMQGRPIVGTTDWKHYAVVLDVAEDASNIAFGVLLSGRGTIWFDDLTLEIVSKDIPVTDMIQEKSNAPKNLNFEN